MKINNLFLLCLLIVLASCTTAKKASEVKAVYISAAQYTSMSCEELFDIAEEIRFRTPALARAVDQSRKKDKTVEQVGMWLFWPAVFFLEGNADEQSALALAKGQLEAIRSAGIKAKCGVNQINSKESKEEERIKELQVEINQLKKISEKKKQAKTTESKIKLIEDPSKEVSIQKPTALRSVAPDYNEDLRARDREGTVIVLFNVDTSGEVFNASVFKSSGYKDLDQVVLNAVKESSFSPALRDEVPFNYLGMKRKYTFSLED